LLVALGATERMMIDALRGSGPRIVVLDEVDVLHAKKSPNSVESHLNSIVLHQFDLQTSGIMFIGTFSLDTMG